MYTLIIILGIVLFIVLVLALIAPKNYHVYRSIELNHPTSKVWEHIKYLEKQTQWSPWSRKDPNMEQKIIGTDGTVGAVSYWNGNKEVGEGEQEITKIVEGKRVEQDLRFLKPYKSESECYMDLIELGPNKSKLTWGFAGQNKFPMSIMMLFMNMDKMVGKDFEQGLQNLKAQLQGE
ncbi:Polyketide cyclase / dehydrase and lipid transport [Maribacter sedimenticola]|uniref:Polyketide cyclase / dehydrase and lipid transport n=1 Tax=Maribacter sedimenticola TaxID=228956 RepID=A0ABY1SG61_9FLAO|nr:SRPBCC family protein [Maribacter sedimenticola]SNR43420.1 Polyketide cyclase / dehydrase and lipid transport [Maribacter sedimenticola]